MDSPILSFAAYNWPPKLTTPALVDALRTTIWVAVGASSPDPGHRRSQAGAPTAATWHVAQAPEYASGPNRLEGMHPRVTIHMTEVPGRTAHGPRLRARRRRAQHPPGGVHMTNNLPHEKVAELSIDDIYDYRARRPVMTFDRDHFDAGDPEAGLDLVLTTTETVLMMHGPEPDLGWHPGHPDRHRTRRAPQGEQDHRSAGDPVAVPAHRDLLVTPHASDPTMIEPRPGPVDRVDVPGSLTTLIEFATGRAGIPSQGFAVHIPHYLVNTEYPTGAITVLEEISKAGGLVIDQGELPRLAAQVRSEIDDSIASSSENAEVVTALELQHDADVASWPNQLPSGDELDGPDRAVLAGREDLSSPTSPLSHPPAKIEAEPAAK